MSLSGNALYSHETDSEIVFIMPEEEKQITVKKMMIDFSNEPVYIDHDGQVILLDMKDRPTQDSDSETTQIQCKTSGSDRLSDEEIASDEIKLEGLWSYNATKLFLSMYREKKPLVDRRKISTAKKMWELISQELAKQGYKFTPVQTENKWKSLERAYKKKLMASEAVKRRKPRKIDPYERELREILQEQGTIFSPDIEIYCPGKLVASETERASEEDDDMDSDEPKHDGWWTDSAVRCFLAMYNEKMPLVKEKKRGQTAKKMWEDISEELVAHGYNFTPQQVENKWKSLERSYRRKVAKNGGTGPGKKTCPYEKELTEILQKKIVMFPPGEKSTNLIVDGEGVLQIDTTISEDFPSEAPPPAPSTSTHRVDNQSFNMCTCCSAQASGMPNAKRCRSVHYELKEMRAAILKRQEQRDLERREMEAKKMELKRQLVEQAKLKNSLLQTLIETIKRKEDK